jgi:VWFA-related protein
LMWMIIWCGVGLLHTSYVVRAQPTFRSKVDLVPVTVVVSDNSGQPVRDLTRDDFDVFDNGERRQVIEFLADDAAALSLALLLDVSGSMRVGTKLSDAQSTVNLLLASLRNGTDEAAVFTFDSRLHEIQSYTTNGTSLQESLSSLRPFGATSLYDAIAETANLANQRTARHRAVVVFSDGVDTRSELTASEVSGIASSIDVPVYIVGLVSPLDHPDAPTARENTAKNTGNLLNLAHWTGGAVYFATISTEASEAVSHMLTALRHQYVLAFESADTSGWRRIEVRVPNLTVKARSAYMAK